MISYWERNHWLEDTDIALIGSGFVGLYTALELQKKYPNRSISMFERGALPFGASTKNAGFACFGTAGEVWDDLSRMSREEVCKTVALRYGGLQHIQKHFDPKQIQYYSNGGFELFSTKSEFEFIADNLKPINEVFEQSTDLKNLIEIRTNPLGQAFYKKCLYNKYEGQLNPVLLLKALMRRVVNSGIQLNFGYELKSYSTSSDLVKLNFSEDFNPVRCNTLVLTTNAFANDFLPNEDIIPYRNQVLITERLPSLAINGCYHIDRGYIYIRNVEDRLLIGGARNLDLEKEQTKYFGANTKIEQFLTSLLEQKLLFKKIKIEKTWSGIIASGKTKAPLIKQIENNVFCGVRLGGMGVAIGSQVAKHLSHLI